MVSSSSGSAPESSLRRCRTTPRCSAAVGQRPRSGRRVVELHGECLLALRGDVEVADEQAAVRDHEGGAPTLSVSLAIPVRAEDRDRSAGIVRERALREHDLAAGVEGVDPGDLPRALAEVEAEQGAAGVLGAVDTGRLVVAHPAARADARDLAGDGVLRGGSQARSRGGRCRASSPRHARVGRAGRFRGTWRGPRTDHHLRRDAGRCGWSSMGAAGFEPATSRV